MQHTLSNLIKRQSRQSLFLFFFLNDPPPPKISPLPLHDALPICSCHNFHSNEDHRHRSRRVLRLPNSRSLCRRVDNRRAARGDSYAVSTRGNRRQIRARRDRKSTRLNSSHLVISYAVFCLKKKNK